MTPRISSPALLLASIALLAACEKAEDDTPVSSDPATQYTERGALAVGHAVLEQTRKDAEPLQVKAWYPAEASADETISYAVALKLDGFGGGTVPILGDAALDASPDTINGPYPLVVLSHGFGMNPEWYHPTAEHLASHGFVVLGPEHDEADWFADVIAASTARPRDISATIDLAAAGALDGVIDTEHIAVIGHSYGGYAALAAAGARFDMDRLAERCADVTDEFTASYFCTPFLAGEAELAAAMGLEAIPEGLWPSLGDSRVDAIVPMAGDAFLFGEQGLAEITVPAMMLGGTGDTGSPWAWATGLAFDHVSSPSRVQVALEGAEHFIPVTTCDRMPWTAQMPEEFRGYICEDPAWDKPEALALINQVTTAFLLHTLTEDAGAEPSLDPSVYQTVDGFDLTVIGL